jgi:hypothetical protein
MIAGHGFTASDRVVYQAVPASGQLPEHPQSVPARSSPLSGTARIVQSGNLPHSLTIQLPEELRPHTIYRLWVVTATGQWSEPLSINDPRPLWLTPSYTYATEDPGGLGRRLRVIGRNLEPIGKAPVEFELRGPRTYRLVCESSTDSEPLQPYVAEAPLAERMVPGLYSVRLSVDGHQWTRLEGQQLEVRADAARAPQIDLGDPRFGGCHPNDGADDGGCLQRALAFGRQAGRATINIPSGVWDIQQPLVVPANLELRGAPDRSSVIARHGTGSLESLLSLLGHNTVSGITFTEADRIGSLRQVRPMIQLGSINTGTPDSSWGAAVTDFVITGNRFRHVGRAIADSGHPIARLFITHNEFAAYDEALQLKGSRLNPYAHYELTDSLVRDNRFIPGSYIDIGARQGTIASELGASLRVDFSANVADGTSTDGLQDAQDPRGWRAAFFWDMNGNHEYLLVSRNRISCPGDKAGDGEAIAYDGGGDTFAFNGAPAIESASHDSVVVRVPLQRVQNDHSIDLASYYVGHWVQVVAGSGAGQARKIVGYSLDAASGSVTFQVAPAWDVVPAAPDSRIIVGREYWQVYTLANEIEQRSPPCAKSNLTDRSGGAIVMWAPSADSLIAANRQLDTNGITFQQQYSALASSCKVCFNFATIQSGLEIRDNRIEGEYDWSSDCSRSGITGSFAAGPAPESPPPTLSFGVTIADNLISRADGFRGGAIDIASTWYRGPPGNWPLVQGLMIYRNTIQDISGSRPRPNCHYDQRGRIGIRVDGQENVVSSTLWANRCERVDTRLQDGGRGTVRLCVPDADSCECP